MTNKYRNILLMMKMVLFLNIHSYSMVNKNNGKYYLETQDMKLSEFNSSLSFSRYFNSQNDYRGFFGYNWGSIFENEIKMIDKDHLSLKENGNGSLMVFTAINPEKFINNEFGNQEVIKTSDGYKRAAFNGIVYHFDLNGRETSIVLPDKNVYVLTYTDNLLSKVSVKKGYDIYFTWNSNHFVEKLTVNGQEYIYNYDKNNNLMNVHRNDTLAAEDTNYHYDENHNITQLLKGENILEEIVYDLKTGFVKRVNGSQGAYAQYSFEKSKDDPEMHFWTDIELKISDTEPIKKQHYEYEYKIDTMKKEYLSKLTVIENGQKSETQYNSKGQIEKLMLNGILKVYHEYDGLGRVIKEQNEDGIVREYKFEKDDLKVKEMIADGVVTKFEYNADGFIHSLKKEANGYLFNYNSNKVLEEIIWLNGLEKRIYTIKYDSRERISQILVNHDPLLLMTFIYKGLGDKSQLERIQYTGKDNTIPLDFFAIGDDLFGMNMAQYL